MPDFSMTQPETKSWNFGLVLGDWTFETIGVWMCDGNGDVSCDDRLNWY